ncbi:hypothetical protein LQ757_18765 [Agromyces sp. SYSU K20354]|uniref:hypothetical protein n=1 Tax=Agromyces cavernae TaxID=2898659 RepID=UPI001E511E05|nr:hypothetical protein [Agromyces cavernae]MCD2444328.1 hypothetical protein [Agromyces cavernae]
MEVIHSLITLAADLPDPAPVQPPGTDGLITIMGWLKWVGFFAAIAALIIGAIMIMFATNRGEGMQDALMRIGRPILAVIVIAASTGLVGLLMGG